MSTSSDSTQYCSGRRWRRDDEFFDEILGHPSLRVSRGMILDDYRLVKFLGRGAMGEVWEAEQLSLERQVALKLLTPNAELLSQVKLHLEREARAGGRLSHPGIVQTYAYGFAEEVHFIAQELVPGGFTFEKSLKELGTKLQLPEDYYRFVAEIFEEMALALQFAHDAGVVHRDIKPGNILITEEDRPKVTDFGLAKVKDKQSLFPTGAVVGSLHYMSPEQAMGKRIGIDHRTDIFSLGATLYETLTFTKSFNGDTPQQILEKIRLEEPKNPRKIRSRIPFDLCVICLKALEKEPAQRYQTMSDFAQDLRRFMNHEPIVAKPSGWLTRTTKWLRRHPTKSVAAALLLVGLPTVGVLGTWTVTHFDDVKAQVLTERKQQADRLLQAGFLDLGEEQESRALEQFKASMALSRSPEAVMGTVEALLHTEGHQAALSYLDSESDLEEQYPDLGRARAQIFRAGGNVEDAEKLLSHLPQPSTAEGWFLEGRRLVAEGIQNQSKDAYRRAIEAFLRACLISPRALYYFECASAMGHLRESHVLFDSLVAAIRAKWPNSLRSAYYVGVACFGNGLFNEAVIEFREALRLDSEYAHALNSLGSSLLELGKREEAMEVYRDTLRLDPKYMPARANLCALLGASGMLKELIAEYREGIRLDPENAPEYYTDLGSAFKAMGELSKAIDSYREAIRLKPAYALAHTNLGNVLADMGELEEAIEEYREAIRLRPGNAAAHTNLGVSLMRLGKRMEAARAHREAIRLDPMLAPAHSNLGNVLLHLGRTEEAVASYQEAIRVDAQFAQAYVNLGRLFLERGRPKEALPLLQKGHELGSKEPGWAYDSAKWVQQAQAALVLEQRLERAIKNPRIIAQWREALQLARFASQRRDSQQSVEILWERAQVLAESVGLELDPRLGIWNGATALELNEVAWPLVKPNRTEDTDVARGLAFAEAAVSQVPDEPMFRDTLAWALFANGKPDEALAESQRALDLAPEESKAEYEGYLRDMKQRGQ